MNGYFLVFAGAGLGGALRHGVNSAALRLFGPHFPAGTFIVNVLGSLIMGLIAGWLAYKTQHGWAQPLRLFLTTGILGGFTTFSAFSLDATLLAERGDFALAALYVGASVMLSIGALMLGLFIMRSV